MKLRFTLALIFIVFSHLPQSLLSQTSLETANRVKKSVFKICVKENNRTNYNCLGFGFVIGANDNKIYLVTAAHVVLGEGFRISRDSVEVQVENDQVAGSFPARILSSPNGIPIRTYDVLVLELDKPQGFSWNSAVESFEPANNRRVRVIGKNNSMIILNEGGLLETINEVQNLSYPGLVKGCSGAPVVDCRGIVGMVISDDFDSGKATSLRKIREIATHAGKIPYTYSLKPGYVPIQLKEVVDYLPAIGQFNQGKPGRGIMYTVGTAGGVITGIIANNIYNDNLSKSNQSINVSDQIIFREKAKDWETVRDVSFILGGTTLLIAIADGIFSKGSRRDLCIFNFQNLRIQFATEDLVGMEIAFKF